MTILGAYRDIHKTDGQGRRTGKERKEERKREERKVGSEDKGEGGSVPLSDASGRVTSEEEECRAEGEKQAEKPQGETERRKCCAQVGGMRLSGIGILF